MMKRRDIDFIKDIRESIRLIESYTEGISKLDFFQNQEKQDAVINRLLVIGEATKLVSPEIRDQYPEVPWNDMAGMRDILIHKYHGIDLDIVWETVNTYLPEVAEQIDEIIKQLNNK